MYTPDLRFHRHLKLVPKILPCVEPCRSITFGVIWYNAKAGQLLWTAPFCLNISVQA